MKEITDALGTEEKIKIAAIKVFTEKGFAATKTRDIAEAAGINIASLHYYYRSKEKLFEIVISETMFRFSRLMHSVLDGDIPLHQKIRNFAAMYIDFLKENPMLPMFILSESNRNPLGVDRMMDDKDHLPKLQAQIDELVAKGVIRPISLGNFFSNLVGMTIFPFLSIPLMKIKIGMDEEAFLAMIEERKEMIPDMIIKYLYLKSPE